MVNGRKKPQSNLEKFLSKVNEAKINSLKNEENEYEIKILLKEAERFLTQYLIASEEEKIRKIIKQLEEINLSEHLKFSEEILDFDAEKDYYKILEIDKSATSEEIRKSYRKLAQKWHPDKWISGSIREQNLAEEKWKEIQNASDILLSDSTRKYYDASKENEKNHSFNPSHSDWGEESRDWGWGGEEDYEPYDFLKTKKDSVINDIREKLRIPPGLEESEISSFLLFPYTNFVDKINSLNIEKEINKLHSRILKDIKDNRDKKKTLLKIRENSIKEIESLLKETKLEIEDIDKKEYKKLFLEFDNSHECSLLTNYKKHINFCLSEANKIALFKSKLINLIREAHNNFDQFKQETINEIKKEFFPFKLEEEMEGFETSSWGRWEKTIKEGKSRYEINEFKSKFLQFIGKKLINRRLEKIRSDSIQEIKETLNPEGKISVQVNEINDVFFRREPCSCLNYQDYEEHIKIHLKNFAQIIEFKEKMVASIENKREEKRNSRTQRKKSRKNLENFLEKTIAKEIEKIEKLEEIELLIEKSNGLLLNDLYTKDEKNSIQSSRKQLEKKKEELRNEGRSKKEKDLLITRLEISLKEANEKNYSLNKKIELLEKQQKTWQSKEEEIKKMNENLLKELSDEKNKDNLLQQELEMIKEISKKQKEENELFQEKLKDRDKEINLLKEQALNHKQLISKYLINQESQIQELRFNFDCFQKNESIESRVEMPPKS